MAPKKGFRPPSTGAGKGWLDQRGYRWLYVFENGRRRARREHRVVMEQQLGRRLEPWELVHHKDGDKTNNSPDNLELREFGEHTAEHSLGRRQSDDTKRRIEAFALMRGELIRERELKADLLEAAAELVSWYGPFNPTKHPPEINGAWLRMVAAINKARGVS